MNSVIDRPAPPGSPIPHNRSIPSSKLAPYKDLLLVVALVVGAGIVFAGMFTKNRVPTPQNFNRVSATHDEIERVAHEIDAVFQRRWEKEGITPALPADDLTVARRLSLGLAGTVPSLEEIRKLEGIPTEQRFDWWMARLLEDRRFHDHLAERFARAYVGVADGPFILFRRHRFVDWLSESIAANRPYDQIVRELVSDNGLWTDTPQVNYVSATSNPDKDNQPDPIKLAAKTSRAFLAMRIDCLECHNDFLGNINLGAEGDLKGGEQSDFHHLAAFFGEVKTSLSGIQDQGDSAAYEFQLLGEEAPQTFEPQVPYLPELLPQDGPLRTRLATWITHPQNLPFARATVNRLWAVMFGRSLVEPIDDIPWGQPLPEELEILAHDFIEHGFDLQRTLRIIASTRVFQLDSRLASEITPQHLKQWAVFPVIRLRPEQVSGSLLQATSLSTIDSSANVLNRVVAFGQQNEFVNRFGDFGRDEFVERGETVTQRLLMLNGDMIRDRLTGGLLAPSVVNGVAPNPEKMAEVVYLSCFTRYPDAAETQDFVARLHDAESESGQAQKVIDFYWSLLNSAEFSWNH